MRNQVFIVTLSILFFKCHGLPQRRIPLSNKRQVNTDFNNAFDSIDEPLRFNLDPLGPSNRPDSRQEFNKVPKLDLIENLAPPKFDNEEENFEGPIKEFEYVPPSYLEDRDPPYNVILLTLPRDDELVRQDTTERVPVIDDPRYSKFRPTRISAFGSELVYLQSRKEYEEERKRQNEEENQRQFDYEEDDGSFQ